MLDAVVTGTLLGISAGITPGPLMTLVVTQTLKHNVMEGIKVALAPLLTDIPIVAATLFLLSKMAQMEIALGILSMAGSAFIFFLAYGCLRTRPVERAVEQKSADSVKKGTLVNLLSPYPYLFWLSVGGPTVFKAQAHGITGPISFLASFYLFLVGGKIVIAVATGKSRRFLQGGSYIFIMRLLGVMLSFFAVVVFRDGLKLLGWI